MRIEWLLLPALAATACGARSQFADGERGAGGAAASGGAGPGTSASATSSGPGGGGGGGEPAPPPCAALVVDGPPVALGWGAPRPAASPRLVRQRGDDVRVTVVFGSDDRVGHVTLAPWDTWPPEALGTANLVDAMEAASFAVDVSGEDRFALLAVDAAGAARLAPRVLLGTAEPGPILEIPTDGAPPPGAIRAVFLRRVGQARHALGIEQPGDYSGPEAPVTFEIAAGAIDHGDPDAPQGAPWPSVLGCDDAPTVADAIRAEGRWLFALGVRQGVCFDDVPPPADAAIQITSFDEEGAQYFGTEIPLAGAVSHLLLVRRPEGAWITWRSGLEGIRAARVPDDAASTSEPVTVVDAADVPLSMAAAPLAGGALGVAWVEDPMGNPPDVVAAVAGASGEPVRGVVAENRTATGPVALASSPDRGALLVAWEEIFVDGEPGIFLARLVCLAE